MGPYHLPLAVAFLLAAGLTMVNVSAYKQAAVTSSASVTVASTSDAALALTSASPMATVSGGIMIVDFQDGNGLPRQFQQTQTTGSPVVTVTGDKFEMRDVFRVTNDGTQNQRVSVYVSSGSPTNLTSIYGRPVGGTPPGTQLGSTLGAQTASRVCLAPGSAMSLDFHWSATAAATAGNFTIKVSSTYTASCP